VSSGTQKVRILVITGNSGGHIFPALGLLDILRQKPDFQTLLVLPRQNISGCFKKNDYRVRYISVSGVKLKPSVRSLLGLFRFFLSFLESPWILLQFRPRLVVGFGTAASVPMILWARVLGIKTIIHEQNVICGRANNLLARFSDKIAISFRQTKDYLKNYQNKIVFTGNPLRKKLKSIDKRSARDFFHLQENKFTVLVMGGSQGSRRINTGFLESISRLQDKERIQVIHLSGPHDYPFLEEEYRKTAISVKLLPFLEQIHYAYSAADLAVCRGGALTIAELIFFRIPSIIVPYPYALAHQEANAKVLEKLGTCIIIKNTALESNILTETLEGLVRDPERLQLMRAGYASAESCDTDVIFTETIQALA